MSILAVILLTARQSTHIFQLPSFLGINKIRMTHGLMLPLTCPLDSSSLISLWSSLVFSGLLWQVGRIGVRAPGMKSIWCSIPLIGGNQGGNSSRKTSLYSCKREIVALVKELSRLVSEKYATLCIINISGLSIFVELIISISLA